MSRISPFVGLLFDRGRVGALDPVTAPPYDVISPAERRRLLDASPYNVIRLDLGSDGEEQGEDGYARAAAALRSWRDQGALVPTPQPSYFPYEMRFSLEGRERRIRGLICALELEEWGGTILPHERTLPAPIEDRLRLTRAVQANLSSIHTVFPGPSAELAGFLERAAATGPDAVAMDEAGVEHRLWVRQADPGPARWLERESLMIADGHHRYTMALRYRDEMRRDHGPGPWDRVMALVVDATLEEPPVLPFHRIQLHGPVPSLGRRVRDLDEIMASVDDDKLTFGLVSRPSGELVYRVDELPGAPPAVCALHTGLLDAVGDALLFTPDALEAEEAVQTGKAVAAYLLPPTDAARIRALIDRGKRLPPKSTFFWPKPRTGLVIRPFDLG